MPDQYPIHGRRRRWYAPWRTYCRCGMNAYPCIVEQMLNPRSDARRAADRLYSDGLRYASGWRDSERRRWDGRR